MVCSQIQKFGVIVFKMKSHKGESKHLENKVNGTEFKNLELYLKPQPQKYYEEIKKQGVNSDYENMWGYCI